jgi:hypothetical protein
MGRVLLLGLDAQSLAKSPRRDAAFAAQIDRLRADIEKQQLPVVSEWVLFRKTFVMPFFSYKVFQERNHVKALDYYAHGCVFNLYSFDEETVD